MIYRIELPTSYRTYKVEAVSPAQACFYIKVVLFQQRMPRNYKVLAEGETSRYMEYVLAVPSPDQIERYKEKFPAPNRPQWRRREDAPPSVSTKEIMEIASKVFVEQAETLGETISKSVSKEIGDLGEAVKAEVMKDLHIPRVVEIRRPDKTVTITGAHPILPDVVSVLSSGCNCMVVGPTGSGKSHLSKQVAEALGVSYLFTPQALSKFDLTGIRDATGTYHPSPLREAWDGNSLHVFEEFDAFDEQAALAANLATSNRTMQFADSPRPRPIGENVYLMAAANTWGNGADREYVGRNQMDAATPNRFVILEMDYDRTLETSLANGFEEWRDAVWHVRQQVRATRGMRHPISTRNLLQGIALLQVGWLHEKVVSTVLRRHLSESDWGRIRP